MAQLMSIPVRLVSEIGVVRINKPVHLLFTYNPTVYTLAVESLCSK